jgi:EAL domain-containing protein (putative c-di-GMP-specific phosphodiesterase class I)
MIEECLRENRIKLLYQTVYRIADNAAVMHEVFARLVTPEGRVMQPAEFLPVATEYRLMLELDLAVFRKVMAEHFDGGGTPLTPLALNISSTSLDGVAYLQEMANQGPRVLQKLAFEVRSQEMIKDPKAMRLLKDLQKHGGNLAVDYFGGGTGMLEASKTMGFNYVKLDCARFYANDEGKKELIVLCQKAQQLDLPVILEKVGSEAMQTFARKVGANFMQGYALNIPRTELSIVPLSPGVGGVAALVGGEAS